MSEDQNQDPTVVAVAPTKAPEQALVARSEAWLSSIAAVGVVLTAYFQHISTYIAIGVCIALAATFAIFKTPLVSSKRPGVKTKAFWTSVVIVVGSIAAAVSELEIPGIPPKVAHVAGMVSAAVTALGYQIWRYRVKTK